MLAKIVKSEADELLKVSFIFSIIDMIIAP